MVYGVYIGRFQVFHNGHLRTLRQALESFDRVVVVLGSCNAPSTPKNPFKPYTRRILIEQCLAREELDRVHFVYQDDHDSNATWMNEVYSKVRGIAGNNRIVLTGLDKDASSFYLRFFPMWGYAPVKADGVVHDASYIRALWYRLDGDDPEIDDMIWDSIEEIVPVPVFNYLVWYRREIHNYETLVDQYWTELNRRYILGRGSNGQDNQEES